MAGKPFADHFIVKRRGGVAYFAVEGSGGLKSRLDTIAKKRGVAGVLPFTWRSDCPPLTAADALAQLILSAVHRTHRPLGAHTRRLSLPRR